MTQSTWSWHHEVQLSLVKALTTDELITECRLRCGVAGQLTVNRYTEYEGLAHVFNDAGGNNFLILLDMARTLMSTPSPATEPVPIDAPLAENAGIALNQLREREYRLIRTLAENVTTRPAGGLDPLEVWNPLLRTARDVAKAYGLGIAMQTAITADETIDDEEGCLNPSRPDLVVHTQSNRSACSVVNERSASV